jgi:hypothetical protein
MKKFNPNEPRDALANLNQLIAFWKSGKTIVEAYPADCLPWLPFRSHPNTLPWACAHLDD